MKMILKKEMISKRKAARVKDRNLKMVKAFTFPSSTSKLRTRRKNAKMSSRKRRN